LTNDELKPALLAEILRLPAEGLLADQHDAAEPDRIYQVRKTFRITIGQSLHQELLDRYHSLEHKGEYSIEPDRMGERALRNLCLAYLMSPQRSDITDNDFDLCISQYEQANNMTDVIAALACLCSIDDSYRTKALAIFERRWKSDALVMDKWFTLQATSELPGTLEQVQLLMQHDNFNIKNPNKVRSLIGAFANANPQHFHALDGSGYEFVADRIIQLDRINPQIAARLTSVFSRWRQYNQGRQVMMQQQLQRILDSGSLSKDVYEIASKSLGE
jgi:aminopeptidase N